MEIDEDIVRKLAAQIDPDDDDSLALLFIELLQAEHSARHHARPRLVSKFTEKIDDEQGEL